MARKDQIVKAAFPGRITLAGPVTLHQKVVAIVIGECDDVTMKATKGGGDEPRRSIRLSDALILTGAEANEFAERVADASDALSANSVKLPFKGDDGEKLEA